MYLEDEEIQQCGEVSYVSRQNLTFLMAVEGAATVEDLLLPVMENGRRLNPGAPLPDLRARARREIASLPEELRRLRNPEIYTVGLSPALGRMKAEMIHHLPGVLPEELAR